MIAARAELAADREVVLPFARQLRLHIIGLGLHEAYSLPRHSRRDPAPALSPPIPPPQDDPRFLPAVTPGQLSLIPAPPRRIVRADRYRIAGRSWLEEAQLAAHAEQMAADAALSSTWPYMVMSLLRLALAVRDADGEGVVAEEVLDQIDLPLKRAAGQVLQRAGLLRPRLAPPLPRYPVRGCADCECWGITQSRCQACQTWRHLTARYPLGRCGRCGRDGLPVHRQEGLCRGCLVFVRECVPEAGRHTQLSFAGALSLQLSRKAGVLGFAPHQNSGPLMRQRARGRATTASPAVSPHLVDPNQRTLFSVDRDWSAVRVLGAAELPALTEDAAALLTDFSATAPVSTTTGAVTPGIALLRALVAWLGARAPFRERDVRALAAHAAVPSTYRVLGFLHQRGLLELNDPGGSSPESPRPRLPSAADMAAERRKRHHQNAITATLDTLPEPMASHLHRWVLVLRGSGRRQHQPVDYTRIRRYLRIALPLLRVWAAAGLDLRQVTSTDIRSEFATRQGSRARDLHHVLRTLFSALKQERLIFTNPMVGISLTTPVRVPIPLPSDRLRGLLDALDGPRARLVVALVGVHGLRPIEVTRLRLDNLDLTRLIVAVSRGEHTHTVYLDTFTAELANAWLAERYLRWPDAPNRHLFITSQSAYHPAQPPLSYCGLRAAFDQVGILPQQLWSDRILHEAAHTADPVHLIRVFGIHPHTAVKYVNAAHPDKALPATR